MFSNTIESWVFLSIACFIGFMIGQWIKSRKSKVKTKKESASGLKRQMLADTFVKKKKTKKKNRRADKKNAGL